MRKKFAFAWLGFSVVALLLSGLAFDQEKFAAYAASKTILTLACEPTKPDNVYTVAEKFKEIAEAKAKGDLEIRFYSGGALGTARQLQEQIQLGSTHSITTASDIVEMEPKLTLFDFPFLFTDRAMVYKTLDGEIGEQLNQALIKNKGVRILIYGELGFRQITNGVRPVVNPEDLKGLKIRVPPSKIRVAAFKAMGAAATPVPYKELYTALQQRVVDGQENPLITLEGLSLWEVQKHVTITNHVYTPGYLLINEKYFQSLPPKIKGVLQESAAETKEWQRKESQKTDREIMEKAKTKGMQIVTNANLKAFASLARPVWDEYIDKVGKDIVDKILSMR